MKDYQVYLSFALFVALGLFLFYQMGVIYEKGLTGIDYDSHFNITKIETYLILAKSVILFIPLFLNSKISFIKPTMDGEINITITLFFSFFITIFSLYLIYKLFKTITNFLFTPK